MIHQIKGLYDDGNGLSIRAISRELGISRNTARKYLQMEEGAISAVQEDRSRTKRLDAHRDYIAHQLKHFPKLSAVKIARRLREKVGDIEASDRSIRRYVQAMKQQVATGQMRYYEPVLDAVPGVQCQVDPGELRGVSIGGQERTLYFVVFVLSCSRLMYVGVAFKPLDTVAFIQMHDEAFRYFGGVTEECVYDQTKMVVIAEQYRELTVNQRFHAYATTAGFRIHACEGYDPESKGKVEAGVKYVKQDCLYGEAFQDEEAVRLHIQGWLEAVANVRLHGTTGQQPRIHFDAEERQHLRAYLAPADLGFAASAAKSRRADKTGLISWCANKYSVPMTWQRARVGVCEVQGEVVINDLETGAVIATHRACTEKGRIIKNTHHYRDHAQRIANLETGIVEQLGSEIGPALCGLLQSTSPRIYKDQLVAARSLLRDYAPVDSVLMTELTHRSELTATTIKRYLEAWRRAEERGREVDVPPSAPIPATGVNLQAYAGIGHSSGQEANHESA